MEGVIRTRVGYAGGAKASPTYFSLGDHAETVQIDYDPARISYEQLLEVFWNSHDPAARSRSRQYASIIFFHSAEQEKAVMDSIELQQSRLGKIIVTEVEPYSQFYLAEDYHQKYYLRGEESLLNEFKEMYPDTGSLIQSTAAARVNGYLGGYGSPEALEEQLDSFGLSPSGKAKLRQKV